MVVKAASPFIQALPAYTKKFKVFQDENDTAPFEEIKGLVEDALGCPLEEVFESFEGAESHTVSVSRFHFGRLI